QAGYVGPNREQPAGKRRFVRACLECGGRDVERLQVGTAEVAVGDVRHRHLDDAVDAAVGPQADDAAAAEATVPHATLGVDGRSVGRTALETAEQVTAVGNAVRLRVVVVRVENVGLG